MQIWIISATAIVFVTISTICLTSNKVSIPDEPPKITLKSSALKIFYVVEKNKWDGAVYGRENNSIVLRERIFNRDMPHIKNDAKITISFDGNKPDNIILSEIILDKHEDTK